MEFKAHLPNLDNVGGTIRLHCLNYGPTPYALREEPGLLDVVWDVNRDDPAPDLAENQRRDAVIKAAAAQFVDAAGNLAFVYDAEADDHLRIYGLPQTPPDLVKRYLANRPPVEFNWGILDMPYAVTCTYADKGYKSLKSWSHNGQTVCQRTYTYVEGADAGGNYIDISVTPSWFTKDGTKIDWVERTKRLQGNAWTDYRVEARSLIYSNLKFWVPLCLIVTEEAADVTEARTIATAFLASGVGDALDHYVGTGDSDPLEAALAANGASWLANVIPAGTIDGVASGKTIEAMILEGLR